MLFVCEITFTSCKDKEEVVDDVRRAMTKALDKILKE